MRDQTAAAMPAQAPETVLPYDPDDWERRLAEARRRREAVLRRQAAMAAAQPDPVFAPGTRTAPRAVPPSSPASRRDPEDWQRRLAEARGIAGRHGSAPAPRPASRQRSPEETSPASPARAPAAGVGAALAPHPVPTPTPHTHTDQAGPAPAGFHDAQGHRPAPARTVLAGLGGLAAGVTLTLVSLGPADLPARSEERAAVPAMATAGIASVTPTVAGFAQPPATVTPAARSATADPLPPRTVPTLPPVAAARAASPAAPAGAVMAGPPPAVAGPTAPALAGLGEPPDTAPNRMDLPTPADALTSVHAPTVVAVPDLPAAATIPNAPVARPAAPPDRVAAADPTAPFVVVHTPRNPAPETAAPLAESRAAGWPVVAIDFTVSRSHLRIYHDADRDAAAALGARLGLPVRDFVGVVPAPPGLIEVWLAGGAG
jgi:hypothetical protein